MVVRRRLCLLVHRKERKARKAFHKAMKASRKVVSALSSQKKGAGNDFVQHKGRGEDQKKRARKARILNLDCQPPKHPVKKDMAMPGHQTTWSSSHWPDESSTSAAGWSGTKACCAWMAAVPLLQETRVSGQKMSRFWTEMQKVKLSTTFLTSCLTSAT